jgi:release factor glutamine methyltransferase
LSAEWLLSDVTGLSRIELYAYFDRPLSVDERTRLREGVRRRAAGEPLQYVTGEVAFRHLVVRVRPGVLIPRPETEVLVDEVLREIAGQTEPMVADVCTGSGCVALSIAHEHDTARVWAGDLSPDAVEAALENAARLGLADRVDVRRGDLFEAFDPVVGGGFDVVVANPPYIPSADLPGLPGEIRDFEPAIALDGGPDGLALYRRILMEAPKWLRPGGLLLIELDERRVRSAAEEAVEWYEQVKVVRDLAGRDRIVSMRSPGRTGNVPAQERTGGGQR